MPCVVGEARMFHVLTQAVNEHNVRAAIHERARDGCPKVAGGSCDDDALILEIHDCALLGVMRNDSERRAAIVHTELPSSWPKAGIQKCRLESHSRRSTFATTLDSRLRRE